MMALPKAISHGSNGAGAGALALTAISAAEAAPENKARGVAIKTIFFMTIPIVVRSVRLRRPQAQRQSTATNFRGTNLRRGILCVKLKRQATAAFLGVFILPKDVVGLCCIRTTIFGWNPCRGPDLEGVPGAS